MVKTNSELNWYVYYIRGRHEKKIALYIKDTGVTVYLPLHKQQRQWSDRKKWVEVPLFQNYIFVQIKEKEIFKILKIPGVVKNIKFNNKPAIVNDDTIKFIDKLSRLETFVEVENMKPVKGSKVTIMTGPMKGLEGIIAEVRGKKKLLVDVECIAKRIIVETGTFRYKET